VAVTLKRFLLAHPAGKYLSKFRKITLERYFADFETVFVGWAVSKTLLKVSKTMLQ